MSWLFFLDESGHDHRQMPYEVRGGFAIHTSKLWPFIQAVRTLEQSCFGAYLHDHGSEVKGEKLLRKDRFKWDQQGPKLDEAARRKHALNFLLSGRQSRTPRRDEFTAFGQASLMFTEQVLLLLQSHEARVFAAAVPATRKPSSAPADYLRKDHVFLLERYFYFLEEQHSHGLLIMDESDKTDDRRFVRRMERYFTMSFTGRQRTQWIVPVPLFVESDMAYGVQIADLVVYCINWGLRLPAMVGPVREEIRPFAWLVDRLVWRGEGRRQGQVFRTQGVVFVPDLYEDRKVQK